MNSFRCYRSLALIAIAVAAVGCSHKNPVNSEAASSASAGDSHDHADSHSHPSEGPHHGTLIELGNEEYHAELVHDDQVGTVTVYILDAKATTSMPIDSQDVTINAKRDGKPVQFQLNASPLEEDPSGKASRFVSEDAELASHLDQEVTDPRLVVVIGGKAYRGEVHHNHADHHDHNH